ncbi:MAG: bifunctional precorrin-2 dehydrogenase/sirohydrochlorin ferrochelatase [Rhodothermales bacterium]
MSFYPIFLNDLGGRRCVVFGGGHEAERKVEGLLECGADVVVIAPDVTPGLVDHASAGQIDWLAREYREGDLRDAFLAVASETNPAKTEPIWQEAKREKVLINAMDDVPHCTFVAGSVVRRGKLTLAISTSGAAPTLSVRLRQELEERFGPEYELFLEWMASLREPMARDYPDFDERKKIWYELVDSDVLALLREGNQEEALQLSEKITGVSVTDPAAS